MDSADRFELQSIREDQDRLHHLVRDLDHRIDTLARRTLQAQTPRPLLAPPPVAPAKVPPELPAAKPTAISPPVVIRPVRPVVAAAATTPAEALGEVSLELRVGTFWLARIGMAILLTGLVFLGNYAYHRIVPLLGPWGKLSLLSLAGVSLAGIGFWMEHQRESLKSFGRVLIGGGLAALYYTVYAAHFVERLRVIESPLLGGILLLAIAAGIAWFAQRRRSETVAIIAILLSYYTAAINPIGGFTLFSSLLLTSTAVYSLVQHRWTRLTTLSLVGTYSSYAFWRFYQFVHTGGSGDLWSGLGYLAGYWLLFTVAVFLVDSGALRSADRIAFLSANNAAFFAFATHLFAANLPGAFWMFSVGFGSLLLGLAALSAIRQPSQTAIDGHYLAQGLLLVTVGLIAQLSGPQLAITLALESAALLYGVRRRHGWLYEYAAAFCGVGSFGFALVQVSIGNRLIVGIAASLLLAFNGWWAKSVHRELAAPGINPRALFYGVLATVLAAVALWRNTSPDWLPVSLMAAAVVGLGTFHVRLPELGLLLQMFVPLAAFFIVFQTQSWDHLVWWSCAVAVAIAVGFSHWWQFVGLRISAQLSVMAECMFALVATGVGLFWVHGNCHGDDWVAVTIVVATGSLGYGLATRSLAIAFAGQIFGLPASTSYVGMIWWAILTGLWHLLRRSVTRPLPCSYRGLLKSDGPCCPWESATAKSRRSIRPAVPCCLRSGPSNTSRWSGESPSSLESAGSSCCSVQPQARGDE